MARRMIRSVGIVPNFAKRRCRRTFGELVAWLQAEGCRVFVGEEFQGELPAGVRRLGPPALGEKLDLLVVLGGDGTLLAAARMVLPREVPLLGINFGGIGFLTAATVQELYPALEETLRGEYTIERRMLLRVAIIGRNGRSRATLYGLNDAVLHEAGQRVMEVDMSIGETRVGRFKADGIVVATPTGSTAYSLSAGGPILNPLLDALIATPICAHKLSVRPLVFPAFEVLRLEPGRRRGEAFLSVDGQLLLPLHRGERIEVGRADSCSCFVRLRGRSFYDLLRDKLKWGT